MKNLNDDDFKGLADSSQRLLLNRLYANNGQTLKRAMREDLDMTRQPVTQHRSRQPRHQGMAGTGKVSLPQPRAAPGDLGTLDQEI
jgi:hypothetical protein